MTRNRMLGTLAVGCLAGAMLGGTAASAETAGAQQARGGFPPDTCATGYTWRGARASDHVCVTPATRDRTASENATGTWQSCAPGTVWREAYQGDYRCVVPGSRSQARGDNANAPYRLAWSIMTRHRHDPAPSGCDKDACSTTNESAYYTVGVRGYYLTAGARVTVKIAQKSDDQILWSVRTYARAGGNGPEGSYSVDTGNVLCQGGTFAPPLNAYVQVQENGGPWSPRVPIAWRRCNNL